MKKECVLQPTCFSFSSLESSLSSVSVLSWSVGLVTVARPVAGKPTTAEELGVGLS